VEVLGNSKGRPRAGAFEVTSEDGTVFWSKLGGAGFPDPTKLINILRPIYGDQKQE